MASRREDNSTFAHKKALRLEALKLLDAEPVVLESHGGAGKLFDACYAHITQGVVMEKDADKAAILARQRPTWSVYECDAVFALRAGVGGHLTINLLDCDPYGQCWDVIEGFFASRRRFADRMIVVVNDGLRQKLRVNGAWTTGSMRAMVEKYGNALHDVYLEICAELLELHAAKAGYFVDQFSGYYCGRALQITHFLAVLQKN